MTNGKRELRCCHFRDKPEYDGSIGPKLGSPSHRISKSFTSEGDNNTYFLVAIFDEKEIPKALFILRTAEPTEIQILDVDGDGRSCGTDLRSQGREDCRIEGAPQTGLFKDQN